MPELLVDLAEQLVDGVGVHGVQVAGRLVGQHERRAVHERAGDGHALLLPAGELVGVLLLEPLESEQREVLLGARDELRRSRSRDAPGISTFSRR